MAARGGWPTQQVHDGMGGPTYLVKMYNVILNVFPMRGRCRVESGPYVHNIDCVLEYLLTYLTGLFSRAHISLYAYVCACMHYACAMCANRTYTKWTSVDGPQTTVRPGTP